jgi:hypothetical protein
MPLTKQAQSIITTVETAIKRSQEFLDAVKTNGDTGFNDSVLRLALELAKYADYIKLSLLINTVAAAAAIPTPAAPKRALSTQEQALLQGASEEEKALVERTPPPGFNA